MNKRIQYTAEYKTGIVLRVIQEVLIPFSICCDIIIAVHSDCPPWQFRCFATPFYHVGKSLWIFLFSYSTPFYNGPLKVLLPVYRFIRSASQIPGRSYFHLSGFWHIPLHIVFQSHRKPAACRPAACLYCERRMRLRRPDQH